MQLARLMEPRESRSIGFKVKQILRAIQIERRMSKREILEAYLTLAPYGGNLEGIRAASLAYFGKEPTRLTLSESALLVALPQLPERRRPDRNPAGAHAARDRVLGRMVTAGLIDQREADRAAAEEFAAVRRPLPALAPHAASAALKNAPLERVHQLTISRRVQEGLETVAREAAKKLGPKLSVAMVMADAQTGEILGEVGSSDFFDASRSGWIDMTKTVRSPGSTLKPFIYGLAMEEGLVAQETHHRGSPDRFRRLPATQFRHELPGRRQRQAGAAAIAQRAGRAPARRCRSGPPRPPASARSAPRSDLPRDEPPGLAIGLGGVGITLHDLVQLYTGLSNGGQVKPLHDGAEPANAVAAAGGAVLDDAGRLADRRHPVRRQAAGRRAGARHRLQDRHQLRLPRRLVDRLRRPLCAGRLDRPPRRLGDGRPVGLRLGRTGAVRGLCQVGPGRGAAARRRRPAHTVRSARNCRSPWRASRRAKSWSPRGRPNRRRRSCSRPQGARVDLGVASGNASALVMKIQGGRAPFRWLANGKPLAAVERRRVASWVPDGAGTSTLTVIDAAGRAASVSVFVE